MLLIPTCSPTRCIRGGLATIPASFLANARPGGEFQQADVTFHAIFPALPPKCHGTAILLVIAERFNRSLAVPLPDVVTFINAYQHFNKTGRRPSGDWPLLPGRNGWAIGCGSRHCNNQQSSRFLILRSPFHGLASYFQ
jgi:hypothetical protein